MMVSINRFAGRKFRYTGVIVMVLLAFCALVYAPIAAQDTPAPKAYVGNFTDNTVGVIDTATNMVIGTIPVPVGPHGMVITPDGHWLYVSSDGDTKVSVIDTSSDTVTATI